MMYYAIWLWAIYMLLYDKYKLEDLTDLHVKLRNSNLFVHIHLLLHIWRLSSTYPILFVHIFGRQVCTLWLPEEPREVQACAYVRACTLSCYFCHSGHHNELCPVNCNIYVHANVPVHILVHTYIYTCIHICMYLLCR